jgi:hypothetical protein
MNSTTREAPSQGTRQQPVLSENEIDLIQAIREIPYGKITIFMHAGQPVRTEQGVKGRVLGKRIN